MLNVQMKEGRRIGGVPMLDVQMKEERRIGGVHSTHVKIIQMKENRRCSSVHMLNIQMKEGRRIGGVHAGPESRVLEGVSWDEARQMQDAQPSNLGK